MTEEKYDAFIVAGMNLENGGMANVRTTMCGSVIQCVALVHGIVNDLVDEAPDSRAREIVERSVAIMLLESMRKFKIFENEGSIEVFTKEYMESVKRNGGLKL